MVCQRSWQSLPDDLQDILMDAAVRYHFGNVKDYEEYIIYNETVGAEEWGYEVIEWSLFYTTKILEGGIKKES